MRVERIKRGENRRSKINDLMRYMDNYYAKMNEGHLKNSILILGKIDSSKKIHS